MYVNFFRDRRGSPQHTLSEEKYNCFLSDYFQVISMMKKEFGILFLVGCLILVSVPAVSCRSPAPTVYVAGDGSGDFNCDGKDDHLQINQALKFVAENPSYTTVHLKGPFTYIIDDTLLIGSNTILEGDSNAVIKLANNAGWATMKPLIQQMSSAGNNNITVRGFEVNVNHDGNSGISKGKGYYNIIYFIRCNNVKVYNMYMHDGHGDGLRIRNSQNIQFYNNRISKLGHDGLFAIECNNIEAWNNTITCRTNSGLRAWNSNYVKFHDNEMDSFYYMSTGGPGIQIEKSSAIMDNIEIYNNTFNNTYGPGIWIFNYDTSSTTRDQGKDVYIHHNIFYNTGTNSGIAWIGGILAGGFNNTTIENNVFDGAYNAAIIHMYMPGYSSIYSPKGGYVTIIRNNIIVNTLKCKADPSGGYGVINNLPSTHKFEIQNNCLYNNSAGKYKNCTSTTDIYVDPLFVNRKNHDYHLKSAAGRWNGKTWVKDSVSSPCIDAGYLSSDYSNEPEDNGNRINIGRYGNTIYASKSNVSKNNAPVITSISNSTVKIGENLNFTVKASDADGDSLTYSASGLPTGASLNNKSGFFSWAPTTGQKGTYEVTFKASDGSSSDSEIISISVIENDNSMSLSGKVYDNRLCEYSPTGIFQKDSYIGVGGTSSSGNFRDMIWFNVSEYTSEDEISNVTLSLWWYYPLNSRLNDTVIEIYRPASAWNPGYVSWNKRDNGIAWNKNGGDWYDKNRILQGSTPYATLTLKASSLPGNRYYQLNVTDLVKEYVSGKYPNTGFLIKARTENNNYVAFYSSDFGNSSKVPKLDVTKKVTSNPVVNATLTGAKDNLIRESSPGTIFSSKVFLDVGGLGSSKYRDLILFDLSKYKGATEVSNAALSLFWYYPNSVRQNDTVIEVYRPASSWNSSYVSWNRKDSGIPWNKPGGDWYDKNGVLHGSTPYATLTFKASTLANKKYCELDVTDLVNEYATGKYANTGFLIKARNENNNYIAFYSSDCGNASLMPKLSLTYR